VIGDARGTPLLIRTTPANVRDEVPAVDMVRALPAVRRPNGRPPRRKPGAPIGDRGYGFPWTIAAVVVLGIVALLCPRGSPHGSGLGRRRYVIERMMAWLGNFRRIKACYERTSAHFQAFHELAACVLCGAKLADDG
jgi:transposase